MDSEGVDYVRARLPLYEDPPRWIPPHQVV